MPVYEYQCTVCRKEFEYQHRMSDPPKSVCEACGGALERLISKTSFAFKGGGWYKDLYASAKPEAKGDAGGGEGGGAEKAKPAADTASSPAAPSTGTSTGTGSSGSGSSGSGTGGSSTPAAS